MKCKAIILPALAMAWIGAAGEMAAQGFQFGIKANPVVYWTKAESRKPDVTAANDGVVLGFSYGLYGEKAISPNYALAVGIYHHMNGVKYAVTDANGAQASIHHKLQHVTIPVSMILRTNEIGYMTYFARFGGLLSIGVKSKGIITQGGTTLPEVPVKYNPLGLGMVIGVGGQYSLGGKTAVVGALRFENYFTDVTTKKTITENPANGGLGLSDYAADNVSFKPIGIGLEVGVLF